jgi:lysozyme
VSSGPHAKGIDVSYYQGTIDWSQVAAAGINFAVARVSDGSFQDPQFAANWAGMKANGIIRGAYHYFRASQDGVAQADAFLSVVTLEPGDLPPCLDVETLDGVSSSELETQMDAWLGEIQAKTGMTPMIYTSQGLWDGWSLSAHTTYPLWVANWGVSTPALPSGWTGWTIWQTTDNYAVAGMPGGNPDGDEFNGTVADLQAYVNAQPTPGTTAGASTTTAPASAPATGSTPTKAQVLALPTLQQGDTGANVTTLQNALAAVGYSPGVIDGNFGPATNAAVVNFQTAQGLTADGIVGPNTQSALAALLP